MHSFGRNMYCWRRLSAEERDSVLAMRKAQQRPWHSPPHGTGEGRFLLTATNYEHRPVLGRDWQRMTEFESRLLETLDATADAVHAWVVLPNHYHAVVVTAGIEEALDALGLLHGRTSFAWNGQEGARGRKVWCSAVETRLQSDRHFCAALNYVHHNPVKHGYAGKWTDWPFSSAGAYLDAVGRERAAHDWREYDISEMGADWDP